MIIIDFINDMNGDLNIFDADFTSRATNEILLNIFAAKFASDTKNGCSVISEEYKLSLTQNIRRNCSVFSAL